MLAHASIYFYVFFYFSENLDGIALKKLVNFVNELMERYSQWIDRYVRITLSELFDQQSKIGNVFK
jgi:hypothetical protein